MAVDIPATSSNMPGTLVLRDASGNLSAGQITGNLTGNVTGNVTGNLNGNVTGNVTGNLNGNVTGNLTGTASAIADNSVTSAKIVDGTIVDADISNTAAIAAAKLASDSITNTQIKSDAAIAGTKIAPNFGSQDITIGDKIIHDGDTNTAIRFPAADTVTVETAGSERLRVDSSGNVGIGLSSLSSRFAVYTNSATDTAAWIGNTAGNGWMGYLTSGGDMLYGLFTSGAITFRTSNTTRVLIDNNGNLFAGYLSGGTSTTGGIIKAKGYNTKAGAGSGLGANVFNINWSSPSASLHIDDTNLGNIQLSSDHRIKRNVETQTDAAIDRIKQIRPVKYQYAAYGEIFQNEETVREGFIAHELAEVVPSAVDGEKDAPNQLQSLRLDALCAVLVKAVQELSAKVEALEAGK